MPFNDVGSAFDHCFQDWDGGHKVMVLPRSERVGMDPLVRARSRPSFFVPPAVRVVRDTVQVKEAVSLPLLPMRLWLPPKGECPPVAEAPALWERHGYRSLAFHEALDFGEAYLAERKRGLPRLVCDPLLVGIETSISRSAGSDGRALVLRFYETEFGLSLLCKDPDWAHLEDDSIFLLTPRNAKLSELAPPSPDWPADRPYVIAAPRHWDPTLGPDPFAAL